MSSRHERGRVVFVAVVFCGWGFGGLVTSAATIGSYIIISRDGLETRGWVFKFKLDTERCEDGDWGLGEPADGSRAPYSCTCSPYGIKGHGLDSGE